MQLRESTKGVVAVIASAIFFGVMPLMVKTVCGLGGNSLVVAFYRYLLSLPFIYAFLKWKKIDLAITRRELRDIILITIFGYCTTTALLFFAYNFIPLGTATVIHFTYPVFTLLGCIIFLREKLTARKLVGTALCFAGILLFYDPSGQINLFGAGIALVSGMTYALYTIMLKGSCLRKMPSMKLIFYLNIFSSIEMLVVCAASGNFTWQVEPAGWAIMLLIAVLCAFLGVLGYQAGVKKVGPESTTILSTFEPVTCVIGEFLVFGQEIGVQTLVGCTLVVVSVILVASAKYEFPRLRLE